MEAKRKKAVNQTKVQHNKVFQLLFSMLALGNIYEYLEEVLARVLPHEEGGGDVHVEGADHSSLRDLHARVAQRQQLTRDALLLVSGTHTSFNRDTDRMDFGNIID